MSAAQAICCQPAAQRGGGDSARHDRDDAVIHAAAGALLSRLAQSSGNRRPSENVRRRHGNTDLPSTDW
jgi:hypothetical protein